MKYLETLSDIWAAIDAGKKVYWVNKSYEVHPVENNESKYAAETTRGDKALRCTCTSNGFGSYLAKTDFEACFTE